jgi:serine/threonine-protein kinase mTOR
MYAPLATELYNIAFVSCWRNMQDADKKAIMESFDSARKSNTRTTQVLQTILNLAEFMELDEISDVMFGSKTLANIAVHCNTLAKALYYWEKEFENNPQETIKLLIQTNHDLQQPEAARGVLTLGEQLGLVSENDLEIKEKSQEWQEILTQIGPMHRIAPEKKIQS